jgi:O-antigen/teichoic acid export membrane protein
MPADPVEPGTPGAAPRPEGEAEAHPSASIAGPAIRGSLWTLAGYGGAQVIRLASNLVLTRLLFPEVFAQMALVWTFLVGLQMFSDVGTGPAIIQSERGEDPTYLDTAWTIGAIRGAFLWLCSCAIAVPVSRFYGQPSLASLLPVMGLTALLLGFESTAMHTLKRRMRLERLTIVELVTQALTTAATVGFALADRALYGPGHPGAVWAVALGGIVGTTARVVLSHTSLGGIRHRLRLDRDAMKALMSFGRWVFVSSLLTFLAAQSDRLVFGKTIPLALFGVYAVAINLSSMPTAAVLRVAGMVIFPAFSRLHAAGTLGQKFGRVRLPVLLPAAAMVCGLVAAGPFLTRILYDRRYDDAGWILQYLSWSSWFTILDATYGSALFALGRVKWLAACNAAKFVGLLVLIPLGLHLGGFPGALAGLVASDVLKYLTGATGALLGRLRGLGTDALLSLGIAAVALGANHLGRVLAAPSRSNLAGLLGAALVVAAAWSGVAVKIWWRDRHALLASLPWVPRPRTRSVVDAGPAAR